MTQPLFIFTAKNGEQDWAKMSEYRFKEHLLAHEGKTYEIRLRETKRSLTQNRYYWLYLEVISAETGNSANDLHELFRRTLLSPKFINVRGIELKVPRSTTELSKLDFGEYLDRICAETNVPLPDPVAAGFTPNY